jgi:hypothetical protein
MTHRPARVACFGDFGILAVTQKHLPMPTGIYERLKQDKLLPCLPNLREHS